MGEREAEADGKIGGALTRREPVRDLLRTRPALCPGDALGSRCHLGLRTLVGRRLYMAGFVRATADGGGLSKQENEFRGNDGAKRSPLAAQGERCTVLDWKAEPLQGHSLWRLMLV
jgi:hypothetical protein